jgi:hypothetical protein
VRVVIEMALGANFAGRHTILFRYRGFHSYPWLLTLGGLALAAALGAHAATKAKHTASGSPANPAGARAPRA